MFLSIVALSFIVFWGGERWFRSKDSRSVVVTVGDTAIGRYELATKVHQYAQTIADQTGQTPTKEQLFAAGIPQMILGDLIHNLLLDLEAKHLSLVASDDVVREHIHGMKAFQNDKGEFDRERFAQVLRANGFSEDGFINEIREDLIREQLANAVMAGAYVPDEMVSRLFDAQYQHRQASMVVVAAKDIPAPQPPSAEVLEAFYNDHQKEFETPELRTFTVLVLDPATMGKDVSVTEDEIKATFEAKSEMWGKKKLEEVRKQVIAEIQKEKAAEQLYKLTQEIDDKIAGGATFEEVAPTVPGAQVIKLTDVDKAGRDRMENVSAELPKDEGFAQEMLKTIFSLDEGADSPFAQAKNGAYFTARVDKVIPPVIQPFAEIRDRVLKIWTETEKLKAAYAKAEKYRQDFSQGNRNAALMQLLPNMSLSEPSPNVADEVKNLVYSLPLGQAGVAQVPEGFAVVVLNKVIPPAPKVREEKMAGFKEALLKRYKNDILSGYVNALRYRYKVSNINAAALQALEVRE